MTRKIYGKEHCIERMHRKDVFVISSLKKFTQHHFLAALKFVMVEMKENECLRNLESSFTMQESFLHSDELLLNINKISYVISFISWR